MHFNVAFLKKLGTLGWRIPINIKSNEIAKNMDCFFHVNKMCHFIWPGKNQSNENKIFKKPENKRMAVSNCVEGK